jgi:hypothetical protein
MGKEDVIGFCVNPLPGNLFSFFSKLPYLFLLWIFSDGFFVALQAGGYGGHSSEGLGSEIGVAGITSQTLLRMFFMVEGDRLFSPGANTQLDEEEEYKDPCRQSNKEESHSVIHLVRIEPSGGSPAPIDRIMNNDGYCNES